eukprot:m51a1_g11618 hypothetical protein (325) ;mRNA; f:26574-28084
MESVPGAGRVALPSEGSGERPGPSSEAQGQQQGTGGPATSLHQLASAQFSADEAAGTTTTDDHSASLAAPGPPGPRENGAPACPSPHPQDGASVTGSAGPGAAGGGGRQAVGAVTGAFARIRDAVDARERCLLARLDGQPPACSVAFDVGLVDSLCWAVSQLGSVASGPAGDSPPVSPRFSSEIAPSEAQEQRKEGAGLIDELPWSLAVELVSLLDLRSRARFARCCRAAHQIASDASLWRSLELVCEPSASVDRLLLAVARSPQAGSLRHLAVRKKDYGVGPLPKERIAASTVRALSLATPDLESFSAPDMTIGNKGAPAKPL